ncbi:MAG: SpoIIE family protein phosphatase, partial [Phycisphaerae bacterium]|nr:SpoIIE family protein phosphatase [Phycisphaerae bacterium]
DLTEKVLARPVAAVVDGQCETLPEVLRVARSAGLVTILLGATNDHVGPQLIRAAADVSSEQLAGMLHSAISLAPVLRGLHADASRATHSADELDEEMRIASKLQQDFLPRRLPALGDVRFAVLYRPASWVSGDIYDVARLDEQHIGFYVADAVGHGMPAALLTMFIKEAMQTKRISGHSYELIPPHETLAALNADLCSQRLSMCEFCTAIYAILNCQTGRMTISRAGHPAPIVRDASGETDRIELPGPLLGVMDDATYESHHAELERGQRMILYSDGLEDAVCGKGATNLQSLLDLLGPLGELSRQELIMGLSDRLEALDCEDDVTLLLVERE